MQISQIYGISKENAHKNNKATDITEKPSDKVTKTLHP
jgi:hypothetical protein